METCTCDRCLQQMSTPVLRLKGHQNAGEHAQHLQAFCPCQTGTTMSISCQTAAAGHGSVCRGPNTWSEIAVRSHCLWQCAPFAPFWTALYPGLCCCSGPGWWTVAAPMMQADPELSPLLHRTVHILLTVLNLRLPAAWKILQLSVVMLWNAGVQSGGHLLAHGHACVLGWYLKFCFPSLHLHFLCT